MPGLDIVTFAQYNKWANNRLLNTAAQVAQDQLMSAPLLSQKSAFQTLRHMVDIEWSWRLACEGKPATEPLWKIEPLEDLQSVSAYWRAEDDRLLAFVQMLPEDEFERDVTPSWIKQAYPVKHILLHVLNHQTDHRSEVGWHFTKLGYSPGDIGFLDYLDSLRS